MISIVSECSREKLCNTVAKHHNALTSVNHCILSKNSKTNLYNTLIRTTLRKIRWGWHTGHAITT